MHAENLTVAVKAAQYLSEAANAMADAGRSDRDISKLCREIVDIEAKTRDLIAETLEVCKQLAVCARLDDDGQAARDADRIES